MPSPTQAITQVNNEFNAAVGKVNKGGNLDKESFMLLLVTQFKYQDPLNPMEDKEFIAQLAQFSSLEQMMNLNTSMEGLTQASKDQQMTTATSYIGKNVTVTGNMIGKVTDNEGRISITKFRYAPNGNVAPGSKLVVRDAQNNPVYVLTMNEGRMAGQTYEFQWDGKRSDGTPAPDGVYSIGLAMFNAKGEAVLSDQVVDAKVTGIVNNRGEVCLGLDGGQLIKLTDVRQVTDPTYLPGNKPGLPENGKVPSKPDAGTLSL